MVLYKQDYKYNLFLSLNCNLFAKLDPATTHEVVMLFYTLNIFSINRGKIEVSQVAVKRTRQPLACKFQI